MCKRSLSTGRFALSILTLAVALFVSSCKPPEAKAGAAGSLAVAVRLDGAPKVGRVPVVVELTDAGEPVTGAKVKITGDMTHAGMQPVSVSAIELGEGTYRSDDFAFSMAGDWILTVDVTTLSGTRVRGELFTTVGSR